MQGHLAHPHMVTRHSCDASTEVVNLRLAVGLEVPEKNGSSAEKSLVRSGAAYVHHGVLGEHALRQDDVEWQVNALFAELGLHSMQELPP